ncbi:MAG: tetratricopeptide repeat protein [Microbacteriaceae bacterium]
MRGRAAVIVMTALLALYLVLVVQYAIVLMTTGELAGIAMGIALIVIPIIGAWVIVRELLFLRDAQRLLRILTTEGGLPVDDLPRLPSGRAVAEAADAQFPIYKAAVEADPDSWRAWFLLGLAYDASGDRGRARWATREAIRLQRV